MSGEKEVQRGQRRRRSRTQLYIGGFISILCVWWVVRSVEGEEIFARVSNVRGGYLVAAVLVTICSYLLRAWRWPLYFGANAPSYLVSLRCLIVGFFMNNVLPARIGELVRAHLGGVATSQSRSKVLATIAGERLADGLTISLFFAVLFSFGSTNSAPGAAAPLYYVALLFLAASLGVVAVIVLRAPLTKQMEKLAKVMPGHLSSYTLIRVRRFIDGLEPMLRPRTCSVISLASLVVWSIELSAYNFVALAFNHPLSLAELSLFLAAVNFSSLIPAAPGGIGVIEAFATAALVRIGVDRETALAMVAAQHLIQIAVVGLPGAFFFWHSMGGKLPVDEDSLLDEADDDKLATEQKFLDVSGPRPHDVAREGYEITPEDYSPPATLDLSVVIPAYNEELRLPRTLLSARESFGKLPIRYELLVVDDGSKDGTAQVVNSMSEITPEIRLLTYPANRGKGYAVRFGMLNATGSRVLFCDADGATPFSQLERLMEAVDNGADIAIGSRALFSQETAVSTVWYRRLMGRVFNGIVNVSILPGIADTQCGFKLFRSETVRPIFTRQRMDGFSFDVEILYLARKAGFRISEVPVNWKNVPGSKVNLVKDSLRMLRDIVKVRLRDLFGGYARFPEKEGATGGLGTR